MFNCLADIFIIYKYTMFNLDNITKKDNNKDWPYRKLIIGPPGSGKTNYLLNSIQRESSIQKDNNIVDKIYLYAKDLEEPKNKLLIDKREKAGTSLTMILMLLLNILILWMIFYQILKITIKKEEEKY